MNQANDQILIKTEQEIEHMRAAGSLAAAVLDMVADSLAAGASTGDIDDWCAKAIADAGAIAAPLHYAPSGQQPFPKSVCTSVNHQVCHGIPKHDKFLDVDDTVNVDVTVILNGYHGDSSRMYDLGKPSPEAQRLCEVTQLCLDAGIGVARAGNHLADIGNAIEPVAKEHGFSVVREYCGHGLGKSFHEPPQVVHYATGNKGPVLRENMVFTIEPMINAGKRHVKVLPDGWTVVTRDRSLSAQWEHTIRVTNGDPERLTVGKNGN